MTALLTVFFVSGLAAAEEKTRPVIRAHSLNAAPASPAVVSTAAPEQASDIAQRLRVARAAAVSPDHPSTQSAAATGLRPPPAPLAARIGRDVTYLARSGVGTAMQIRGERLQVSVEQSAPGEDSRLATARAFLKANQAVLGLEDPDSELAVRQRIADQIGFTHVKFEQRWKGLSVWPGELIVHLDRQGHVYLMDGAYQLTPRLPLVTPIVKADAALGASELKSRPVQRQSSLLPSSWCMR